MYICMKHYQNTYLSRKYFSSFSSEKLYFPFITQPKNTFLYTAISRGDWKKIDFKNKKNEELII